MNIKNIFCLLALVTLSACSAMRAEAPETFNERMLKAQEAKIAAGEDPYAPSNTNPSSDPTESSLWARSVGSPYIIRNQKAQKVGDLLTIVVSENASADTSAGTDAKKEGKLDMTGSLGFGQGAAETLATINTTSTNKNEFKGEGKTDRSGKIDATVQAVVENVLPNGTLFVRGRKIVTINEEDQLLEIGGFVRPDDIRINNTVASSVLADAKIQYTGLGVISDKQRVGWGTRILDMVWPF